MPVYSTRMLELEVHAQQCTSACCHSVARHRLGRRCGELPVLPIPHISSSPFMLHANLLRAVQSERFTVYQDQPHMWTDPWVVNLLRPLQNTTGIVQPTAAPRCRHRPKHSDFVSNPTQLCPANLTLHIPTHALWFRLSGFPAPSPASQHTIIILHSPHIAGSSASGLPPLHCISPQHAVESKSSVWAGSLLPEALQPAVLAPPSPPIGPLASFLVL